MGKRRDGENRKRIACFKKFRCQLLCGVKNGLYILKQKTTLKIDKIYQRQEICLNGGS